MERTPDIAAVAALLGEPARARMLTALMGGIALTATELAVEAEIAPSTASAHLAKLSAARLVALERQGRHRYFRIVDDEIAQWLESLMGIAARRPATVPVRGVDPELRRARVCYDHLAGEQGVWLFDRLRARGWLVGSGAPEPSETGRVILSRLGVELDALTRSRRPLCRVCLDWTERRHHLAGALGAALLQRMLALRWARREPGGRALRFTSSGEDAFRATFG